MEWLTGNWIWLVLGLGIAWFFFKGGMGCGRGRHGSHGAHGAPRSREIGTTHTGHAGTGGCGSAWSIPAPRVLNGEMASSG